MPKPRFRAAAGGSADDVEASFSEARQHADLDRLMACWASEDEVACIHPSGPRLLGLAAIRASFEAFFSRGPILVRPLHVARVVHLDSAVHTLVERVELPVGTEVRHSWVLASNVYQRTAEGWRLVLHHGSPGSPIEPAARPVPGVVLH